ncbi:MULTISPECIES: helix-turn-helix transcriptional regulator [Enterococcus]|uniref:helix-turn-helix transcriptional regulator n=1 Tax=Enterococcus TaxID=1350 RepID=UPI001105B5BE|nr:MULTISPECIES: WYL domain-containing protein [Enterococcus]MDB1678019.1 WYL domain-containing protein [Enterococcus durans]
MNSNQRILEIFFLLYQGEKIYIDELVLRYQVSKRTIQRDLSSIKDAIDNTISNELTLIYNANHRYYSIKKMNQLAMEEVLTISKVLLESRAMTKNELEKVINHLLDELSFDSSKIIRKLLANELICYYPLKHQEKLLKRISNFTHYITKQIVLNFDYQKNRGEIVTREGLPVSLFFSEYYFYVLLYNPTYQKYLYYRLDRFIKIKETNKKIKIPYKDRLEDSQLRKKTHFMYAGKEITFTFRFWGIIEAALDKLPTSKVIKEFDDTSVLIEATAYDTGVIMWLLSQGANVQVTSPPSFVEKIQTEIEKMQKRYTT